MIIGSGELKNSFWGWEDFLELFLFCLPPADYIVQANVPMGLLKNGSNNHAIGIQEQQLKPKINSYLV